jgi:hypothetical protein
MLHIQISFTWHQRYIILAILFVIKQNTFFSQTRLLSLSSSLSSLVYLLRTFCITSPSTWVYSILMANGYARFYGLVRGPHMEKQ